MAPAGTSLLCFAEPGWASGDELGDSDGGEFVIGNAIGCFFVGLAPAFDRDDEPPVCVLNVGAGCVVEEELECDVVGDCDGWVCGASSASALPASSRPLPPPERGLAVASIA